jgi:hypothetical protein
MNYKYNEFDYAKLIFENGFQTNHIPTELRLLAIYMRRILEYKPKMLKEEMYKFCIDKMPDYNHVKNYKVINRAILQATKKDSTLIKIDKIDIYDYEVNYINTLSICDVNGKIPTYKDDCLKLIFTLLCKMKLNKIISKQKNGKESIGIYFKGGNQKYNELKNVAKISEKIKINEEIINILSQCKVVTIMFNGLIKLNFMEDINKLNKEIQDYKTLISVINYENIGWYWDYYNSICNIKLCKYCNQPFKKSAKRQDYCSNECFNEYRRIYKTNKQQEYRNNVDSFIVFESLNP